MVQLLETRRELRDLSAERQSAEMPNEDEEGWLLCPEGSNRCLAATAVTYFARRERLRNEIPFMHLTFP